MSRNDYIIADRNCHYHDSIYSSPLRGTAVTLTVSSADILSTATSLFRSSLISLEGGRNVRPVTKMV